MRTWGLAQAKAQLSEIVHLAESDGPQVITRSGRDVAMLVSVAEWNKLKQATKPKGSLADFFLNSPLRGSGLKIRKMKIKTKPVEF
jgi:prevent-host-death family protein